MRVNCVLPHVHCRMKGINYRRDEAVGGWFSQIGEMHQVHHLWGTHV